MVRLKILQNYPHDDILNLIDKAVKLTYKHFTDGELGANPFTFHEPDLIYYRAKVLADMGDTNKAIKVLLNLLKSLNIFSMTDRHKDKILGMLYFTLCELLYITDRHDEQLKYAVDGSRLSVEVSSGRYVPDFEFLIAKSKCKSGNSPKESVKHFMHAYAGFFLLGQMKKVTEVVETAKNDFGLTLNLYGMEKLDSLIKNIDKELSRGIAVECKNPVELIERLCYERGFKVSRIYEGIIKRQSYSDVMSGKSGFRYFNLEAIGQRLGIDISIYDNYLLDTNDFKMVNLRDKIHTKSVKLDYNGMEGLLSELYELNKKKKYTVIGQFIAYVRVSMEYETQKISADVMRCKLTEVLKITHKSFNEANFQMLHLTRTEIAIINKIASSYKQDSGFNEVRIYEQLLSIHKRVYIDEVEGDRTLGMIYLNYSMAVGIRGNDKFAQELTSIGLVHDVSCKNLLLSHAFVYNIAYSKMLNGANKNDILPYFLLSYYGASSQSSYHNWSKGCMNNVKSKLLEFCGLDIERK